MILFPILISELISQFFSIMEFEIEQSVSLVLSPILTFGPRTTLGPIIHD